MSMHVCVVCMCVYVYGIIALEQVRAGTPARPDCRASGSIAAESRIGPHIIDRGVSVIAAESRTGATTLGSTSMRCLVSLSLT